MTYQSHDDGPDPVPPRSNRSALSAKVRGHRAGYPLGDLLPLYGSAFCGALKLAWQKVAESELESSSSKCFTTLKMALRFLAQLGEENPNSTCGHLYRQFRDRHTDQLNHDLFSEAVNSVALALAQVGKGTQKNRSRANRVSVLNSVLQKFARYGFIPSIEPIPVNIKFRREALPSMAQLSRTQGKAAPIGSSGGLSFEANAEAMLQLNVARRDALRAALEADLLSEHEAFRNGQEWLKRKDLPSCDEFENAWRSILNQKSKRPKDVPFPRWAKDELRRSFNIDNDDDLIPLVVRQYRCKFPNGFIHRQDYRYSALFWCFGSAEIVRHLESTSVSTTAAFGLLLIETAFNVSSLEDLPCDPFVGGARHGRRMIATLAARKMRAEGKVVEGTIENTGLFDGEAYVRLKARNSSLSGGDVIRIYLEMSKPLRDRASAEVAKMFWLVTGGRSLTGGPVTNNLATMAGGWWPAFLRKHASDPIIGGLPITRQHIRTTELQIAAARGGFGHELAQAIAAHTNDTTTMGYLGAGWFRNQLSRQIREFQVLLEAVFVHRVPGVEANLGVTADELRARLGRARHVGLDFDFGCSPATAHAETVTRSTNACTPLLPCESCPVRFFVPSDGNFRNLHLAHVALLAAEPSWIARNPQRWLSVWLPWRAITEAYVQKISKGPYKLQFARICKAVDAEIASGAVALPIIA